MSSRPIPALRARLHEIAAELREGASALPLADEIELIAEETKRRPCVRKRSQRLYPRLSEKDRAEVRAYAEQHPSLGYTAIANALGTCEREVSYSINGKRG